MRERDDDRPVYLIGVAAGLVPCHPQTLRQYEELGLLRPYRSAGHVRFYSDRDIETARRIREYTQALGVNRAGVEQILRLLGQIEQMREQMARMREAMAAEFQEHMVAMEAEMERLRRLVGLRNGARSEGSGR
jgi:MerR family transcriptional regulator/heat shock protein HspR